MRFTDLLREMTTKLEMSVPPVEEGTRNLELTLASKQVLTVTLLDGDTHCAVSALLCFYPEESQLRGLFEFLLAAHAFGYATDGSSFGVDVDTSKIFLFRTFDLSRIDTDEFLTDLERFILIHKRWLDAYESGRLREQIGADSAALGSDPRQGMVFA